MRVKLTLLPPFASAKLILPVPEGCKTIHDLKKHILESISVISQHASKAKELVLEIDGFELLAGSQVGVIESGDVVSVRLAPGSSKVQVDPVENKKRKAHDKSKDADKVRKKRRTSTSKASKVNISSATRLPIVTSFPPPSQAIPSQTNSIPAKRARSLSSSSSSSSASSSYSSSSDSSSDSELSSSSSYSSSSSASSSSSSSASSSTWSHYPVLTKSTTGPSRVPPGEGKPSTKNRNARRRLAKQYKKKQMSQQPPRDKRTSESVVEAVTATSASVSSGEQQIPVPGSMANRNKKKGFLNDMKDKRGVKTVFNDNNEDGEGDMSIGMEGAHVKQDGSDPNQVNGDAEAVLPFQDTSYIEELGVRKEEMVIPSQMVDLPSNLFVTSAEFPRAPTSPRRSQRRKHLDEEEPLNTHERQDLSDGQEIEMEGVNDEEEMVNADIGDTEETLWQRVEKDFESLPVLSVDVMGSLKVGEMITCKELELDMITYSPALVTKIAKVTQKTDGQVRFEWMKKPLLTYEGYEDQFVGEVDEFMEEEEQEEVILDEGEVAAEKWKLARRDL
ncbi:uncharacterized protein L199_007024 [Kwoniella botswanensis]|uniref:uncharacterized protein n=1 Tax=Kwoniella botswanensis TaxID=1268659 RepID=UPI00315CE8A5